MKVYTNYNDFEKKFENLKKEYNGKMGTYLSLNGFVRDYDIINGEKVPAKEFKIKDIDFNLIENIANNAISKFDLIDVLIYHTDKKVLSVGEAVTSIVVFSRHRREAFEACNYIIDSIKKYH